MRPNPQETADLVTFTEEVLNEKLHFLCSVRWSQTNDHVLQQKHYIDVLQATNKCIRTMPRQKNIRFFKSFSKMLAF